jgi:hypothetical protein
VTRIKPRPFLAYRLRLSTNSENRSGFQAFYDTQLRSGNRGKPLAPCYDCTRILGRKSVFSTTSGRPMPLERIGFEEES